MMENEAFEMDEVSVVENGKDDHAMGVGNGGMASPDRGGMPSQPPTYPTPKKNMAEDERYDEVKGVAQTGNAAQLVKLLTTYEERGWLRDWRNEDNVTLYADAIEDSFLDVIKALLQFDIPLGDGLIRAIDIEYDDAIKAIVKYLRSLSKEIRDDILDGRGDNGDYHPAITPIILAAQRNNYDTILLLLELGASISEPRISLGGDISLTQAVSTLHIYRALSRPAHILATQTDVFGYSFHMSTKLRALSQSWTDFGAELEEMAARIETFTGQILGESGSTEEILALFRFHDTDKYRDDVGRQHPLSKMFEAIKNQQKEFIAHPHTQKAIIGQFYRNLLDWNEKGFWHQMALTLGVMLGYPIISIFYILLPIPKVVNFARQPSVMLLMDVGSTLTMLALIIAITVGEDVAVGDSVDTLSILILIWTIGIAWMHMKRIMKFGIEEILQNSHHLIEAIVIALYASVFFLQWNGPVNIISNVLIRAKRHDDPEALVGLQSQVATALGELRNNLSTSLVEGVNSALTVALSGCSPPTAAPAEEFGLPSMLQRTIEYDQWEPLIVSRALFGVTIVFAFMRLMNLLLIIESVGPLRISLGAMIGDILKFCGIFVVIWFAFSIGMFQNYFSAGKSATRACLDEGGSEADCINLTGWSSFIVCLSDLYWSLFGMVELDTLMLSSDYSVAETIGKFMYFMYHITAVLVLLNALIGMLSNTYNLTEEHADMEWKFHRASLWAAFLRPAGTLPPPFNLIPSVKSIFRFCRYIIGIWIKQVRFKRLSMRDSHAKREFADYTRVMKLIRDRYIQVNLSVSSANSEGIRPRDIHTLRGDITSYRVYAEDRLEALHRTLNETMVKSVNISKKLEDLDPLSEKAYEVVSQNVALIQDTGTLDGEAGTLQEDQATELSDRTDIEKTLREEIQQLNARAKAVQSAHGAETQSQRQQEAKLMSTIRGLEKDRFDLGANNDELEREKAELIKLVGDLSKELERVKASIPSPPTSDETDGAAKQVGFFERVKKFVQESLTTEDQEQKAKRRESQSGHPEERPQGGSNSGDEEDKADADEQERGLGQEPNEDLLPRPGPDLPGATPTKESEGRVGLTPEEDSIPESVDASVDPMEGFPITPEPRTEGERERQADQEQEAKPEQTQEPEVQPVQEQEPEAEVKPVQEHELKDELEKEQEPEENLEQDQEPDEKPE